MWARTSGVKWRRHSHWPSRPAHPVISLIIAGAFMCSPLPTARGSAASAAAAASPSKTTASATKAAPEATTAAVESAAKPACNAAAARGPDRTTFTTGAKSATHERQQHGNAAEEQSQPQTAESERGEYRDGKRREERRHEEGHERQRKENGPDIPFFIVGRSPFRRRRKALAFNQPDQAIHACHDAARIIVLLEARRDLLTNDAAREQIRHRALQTVTDFDAKPAIILGHQQQYTVIDARAAELPRVKDATCIGLNRVLAGRGNDEHGELSALGGIQRREPILQMAASI